MQRIGDKQLNFFESEPSASFLVSKGVVYKCIVKSQLGQKVYVGSTETDFKSRYYNHKTSFNNDKHKNATTLSSYIWKIKERGEEDIQITWEVLKKCEPYTNLSKKCKLCLEEKFLILTYKQPNELLNKRSELLAKCRHSTKFLLRTFNSND